MFVTGGESAAEASVSSLRWTRQNTQWPKIQTVPATLSDMITSVNMQMPVKVVRMFQCY